MNKIHHHAGVITLALALAASAQADTVVPNGPTNFGGGRADFSSVPRYVGVSYSLRQRLAGFKGTAAVGVSYWNGSVRQVTIVRSSGKPQLDAAILRDVRDRYWVKRGRSGIATQPVDLTFPSVDYFGRGNEKPDSEWILRVR